MNSVLLVCDVGILRNKSNLRFLMFFGWNSFSNEIHHYRWFTLKWISGWLNIPAQQAQQKEEPMGSAPNPCLHGSALLVHCQTTRYVLQTRIRSGPHEFFLFVCLVLPVPARPNPWEQQALKINFIVSFRWWTWRGKQNHDFEETKTWAQVN